MKLTNLVTTLACSNELVGSQALHICTVISIIFEDSAAVIATEGDDEDEGNAINRESGLAV